MRHSDVTTGQRASGRTVKSPPVCKTILTNSFRHPVTTSSLTFRNWAHMMRKGTGAAFVRMPDDREGKMVLEYVRWWTFSYLLQGINKLLTFKEQQLSDQERVGSRSPPPPEPTYIWTHFRAWAATQIIATSERSPARAEANPDHERKGGFSTRQPS